MSQQGTRLNEYDAVAIPIDDIYFDSGFNCRSSFTPDSVKELADSIEENGLLMPLVVQPFDGKYRIVAGHRRFTAIRMFLKWETAPCIVREFDERQARLFNLKENIDREDLNLLDEARAIQATFGDESHYAVAKQINRSQQWVSTRRAILDFPESLQTKVAAGFFSVQDCREIARSDDKIAAADQLLKTRKQDRKQRNAGRRSDRRSKHDIQQMIDTLIRLRLEGLPTRLLAWAAGWIPTEEITDEIQAIYKRRKKDG